MRIIADGRGERRESEEKLIVETLRYRTKLNRGHVKAAYRGGRYGGDDGGFSACEPAGPILDARLLSKVRQIIDGVQGEMVLADRPRIAFKGTG
jgi:hypothetical protein